MIDRIAQTGMPDVPARRLRPGEHEDRGGGPGAGRDVAPARQFSVTRRDSVATYAVSTTV